jgi:hypothetical protein
MQRLACHNEDAAFGSGPVMVDVGCYRRPDMEGEGCKLLTGPCYDAEIRCDGSYKDDKRAACGLTESRAAAK